MPQLEFRIEADYSKITKLIEEIGRLKSAMSGMDANSSPSSLRTMETQLAKNTKELDSLVSSAVRAGNEINQGFKQKIYAASQGVNDLSEKIIAQKAVIKNIEADVKRLGAVYRSALKSNPFSAGEKLVEYNAARKSLDEERAALFSLTQQQATARLSIKRLRDEYALYRQDGAETVDVTKQIKESMVDFGKKVLGGVAIKEFLSEMVRVRGEFQAADTSIQTLLGSKEKADALMAKIKEYAKVSPLEFMDVTQATQMMLGFNIEAEKVPRFIQAIGDVSMGQTQKFNSLTLAFSQMSAAGKLMGQDLNQMINAGFNPLQIIADKTGKSIATLKEEMSKGKISADMVQQAFIDATSAGGKFYNMSENASKTITGQLSMMHDSLDAVFNELGQKSEGVIVSGIQMTTKLINNYETIGKVLTGLVVTYGAYRAAIILNIALTRSWAVAARADAVAKGIQTVATKAQTVAQLALNAAMKANPYVMAATLITGVATALWLYSDRTSAAEKAQKKYNEEAEKAKQNKADLATETGSLITKINSETESVYGKIRAYQELKKLMPGLGDMTFTEFKSKGTEEQKSLVSGLMDKQEIEDAEKAYAEAEARVESLRRKVEEARQRTGNASNYNTDYLLTNDLEEAVAYAKLYKDRVDEIREAQWEANTPVKEQIKHYEQILAGLEDQRKMLEETLKYTEDVVPMWEAVSKEINSTKAKIDALNKPKGGSATTDADKNRAQKLREEAAERNRAIKQYAEGVEEQTKQAELDIAQAQLDTQEDSYEKEKATIELRYKRLLAENQKRQKEMIEALKDNKVREWMNSNPEATKEQQINYRASLNVTSSDLTKGQQSQLAQYEVVAAQSRNKALQDLDKARRDSERESMLSYIKEYGEYLDKRTAMEQEAADKIKKIREDKTLTDTDKDYQIKSIEAGLEASLKDMDFDKFKKDMDWDTIFGDMDAMPVDVLKAATEQLEQFRDTAKELDPEQIKAITEALTNLKEKADMSRPIQTIKTAATAYKAAKAQFSAASKAYKEAQTNNDTKGATKAYNDMVKASKKMAEAAKSEKVALEAVTDVIDGYGNALKEVGEIVGGTTGEMIQLAGSAISCGTAMATGVQAFGTAVSTMEKSIAILAIIEAALQAIQTVVSLFTSGPDETLTSYVEAMDTYIDILTESINDLNDAIGSTQNSIKDTLSYYDELIDKQRELADVTKNQAKVWLNSGASSSSHSEGVNIQKSISDGLNSSSADVRKFYEDGYNQLNEYYKKVNGVYAKSAKDFGRMDWILRLSDEDLKKLSENSTIMAMLGSDFAGYITNYVSALKDAEELTDTLNESLMAVSWDDFYDDFVEMVSDMDMTSEDFSSSFAEYMRDALVKNLIAENYKSKLQTLYKKAAGYMQDGTLDEHMDALREEYTKLSEDAQKEIEAISRITGYSDSESESSSDNSLKGAYATASQESIDLLAGQTGAVRVLLEDVRSSVQPIREQMARLYEIQIKGWDDVKAIRDLSVEVEKSASQIADNTADIKEVASKISDYTKGTRDALEGTVNVKVKM